MKRVRLMTVTGGYSDFTPEEVIARAMHEFIGWRCSAGIKGLFIDWDGYIHRGTCQVGLTAPLGNIATGFAIPTDWMTCNKRYCVCNLEITLPKSRTVDGESLAMTAGRDEVTALESAEVVAVTSSIPFDRDGKYVMWALGRRCNYDCSYCDDVAHDAKSPYAPRDQLFAAVDTLHRDFARGEVIRYAFSGGEPTLNPAFLDLVRNLAEHGHIVGTTTNGSRTPAYYAELFGLSHINFSVHFEYAREARLLETARALLDRRRREPGLAERIVGYQLMIVPGGLERAEAFAELLRSLDGGGAELHIAFVPVRERNSNLLMRYGDEELERIQALNHGVR